jgi:hypothetical protein
MLKVSDYHVLGNGMVTIADADRPEEDLALRIAENKPADSFPQKR